MASMRDIKRRIKSVNSTRQITKAMYLVSSAKLQKARKRLEDTRPYYNETRRVIGSIVGKSQGLSNPLMSKREVKNTLLVLISGDRGLCGGYNANVSKAAALAIKDKTDVAMISIGSKGRDYFKKSRVKNIKQYAGISENPSYEGAADIGRSVLDLFLKGEYDEVYLAYTEFKSSLTHIPKVTKILPLDVSEFEQPEKEKQEGPVTMMIYEPDEETVLAYIVPKYINTVIFGALTESSACEQGAIMTSMDSATDNATEIIDDLTLIYNRARQGAITQEITEIVGGVNALD